LLIFNNKFDDYKGIYYLYVKRVIMLKCDIFFACECL